MQKRKALITGVAGQDGSYLAELLLEKGYDVYGLKRFSTTSSSDVNIAHIRDLNIIEGDVTDRTLLDKTLRLIKPHEVYNLAAQSHVGKSFQIPEYTAKVTGSAVLSLLESIRLSGFNSKFYQASTSELYGNATSNDLLNENSTFGPVSPYACAKLFAHNITKMYRESYNMFACCGILFNHESPRRGSTFVTRKLTLAAAAAANDPTFRVGMGNLNSARDWGHAKDYVRGMWMMMQHSEPDDYVLATGESHTIDAFADIAFKEAGISSYGKHIYVDETYYRPTDVHTLRGDASKALSILGWKPEYTFNDLVKEMVREDLRR